MAAGSRLDRIDRRILALLQADGRLTNRALSGALHKSVTPHVVLRDAEQEALDVPLAA